MTASVIYGIVFCLQDEWNFLELDIDTTGWYRVGSMVDGTYSGIIAWTDANGAVPGSVLHEGYGVENTITVRYNGTRFTVDFNTTTSVCTFTGPFSRGSSGFIAGISSEEDFPATAVDIRFRRLAP